MSFQELHDPGFVEIRASLNDAQSLDDVKKIILDTVAELVARRADAPKKWTARRRASSRAWIAPWPTRSSWRWT